MSEKKEVDKNFGTLSSFGIKEPHDLSSFLIANFGTLSSFGIKEQLFERSAYLLNFGTLSSFGIKERSLITSLLMAILVLSHLLV